MDWINSPDFVMGGTVPEKVVYPVKAEFLVSKAQGSGRIYFHDHLGVRSYKPDQLHVIFGEDLSNAVTCGHHKVSVTLHAPSENSS